MSGLYSRSNSRPGRSAWPFLVALIAAVVLSAAACSSPGAPTPGGTGHRRRLDGTGAGRYPARYAGRGPAPVAHRGAWPTCPCPARR